MGNKRFIKKKINVSHSITAKYSAQRDPIEKQKQRLSCTVEAYSSVYTFTTYFIDGEKKEIENRSRPRQTEQRLAKQHASLRA